MDHRFSWAGGCLPALKPDDPWAIIEKRIREVPRGPFSHHFRE